MTMRIPLQVLPSVESTSTHLQNLLRQGLVKTPTALMAHAQTGGRGRMGRSWQSPEGNLYITFALPSSSLPASMIPILPMVTALLLARWVQERFHRRLTLKWPNDLLFAGGKLGGILCESSHQQGQWGDLLIGIGLNLNQTPDSDDENRPIALADILHHSLSVEGEAHALVAFWEQNWGTLQIPEDVLDGWQAYAIEPGQVWQNQNTRETSVLQGISPQGELILLPHAGGVPPLTISTAQHGWRWIYQGGGRQHHSLAVADVGNTRIKVALWGPEDDVKPLWRDSCSHEGPAINSLLEKLQEERQRRGGPVSFPLHGISVSPAGWQLLDQAARIRQIPLVLIPKRPVCMGEGAYPLPQLGIDRLAAMEGALASDLSGNKVCVVVMAGTCITIDVLGLGHRHQGGWILAGFRTALHAMHQATGGLPLCDWPPSSRFLTHPAALGQGTESAMVHGVVAPVLAVLQKLVSDISESEPAIILLGGGDAPLLKEWLPDDAVLDPHLVDRGMQVMVRGG